MLCSKCGSSNDDHAKFCNNCGAQLLGIDDAPPESGEPKPLNVPYYPVKEKKSSASHWYIWAVLLVIAFGFIGYVVGSHFGGSSAAENVIPTESAENHYVPETAEAPSDESSAISVNSAVYLIQSTLEENFDHVNVHHEDGIIYVDVWQDGIAAAALIAMEGNSEYLKSWNDLIESQTSLSNSLYDLVQTFGLKDVSVAVNVMNDMNTDNVLLTILNGTVIYDAVTD